ncbi:MAG: MarR family winged helix-turn-helix transcriptional regulator [Nocardioidaceae bacterium]
MTVSAPGDLYDVLEQFLVRLLSMGESASMDSLVEMDLSFSQARTLFVLAQHCDPVAIHEVADVLGMSVATSGRTIDQLVTQGLVVRREDPDDRRVRRVALSDSGRAMTQKHVDAKRKVLKTFTERLPKHDRECLCEALRPILAGKVLQPHPHNQSQETVL